MNSKRAKVLRKVAEVPDVQDHVIAILTLKNVRTGVYNGIGERQVYKHIKRQDKKLTVKDKELFSADQIRSTLP